MIRDEAIEAGARAIHARYCCPDWPSEECDGPADFVFEEAAAVLDAIGWVEPVGYLAAEPGALIGAYPTQAEAARSGWGPTVYAVVPMEGPSKLGGNEGGA